MVWPQQFLAFMEDMEQTIAACTIRHHFYADNNQLLACVHPLHTCLYRPRWVLLTAVLSYRHTYIHKNFILQDRMSSAVLSYRHTYIHKNFIVACTGPNEFSSAELHANLHPQELHTCLYRSEWVPLTTLLLEELIQACTGPDEFL